MAFPGLTTWSETGTAGGGGVTVDHAAETDKRHICTGFDVSSDAPGVVTIESPANTVLWTKRFSAGFESTRVFPPGTIRGAAGAILRLKISASTSNCEANLQGYTTY